MKNKELHNSFSEEVKQNPAKCKTQEEVKNGSEEADVRHMGHEVLEAVAGGIYFTEPVCCSMSSSNCCFLTCIQISQEAGHVVWHSHLFQNFPQFIVIHTVKGFGIVNKAEIDVLDRKSVV